jgi:hypothetical protein
LSCHLEVFETQIDKECDTYANAIFMVVLQAAPLPQSSRYSVMGGLNGISKQFRSAGLTETLMLCKMDKKLL